jgi:hypothetical protein
VTIVRLRTALGIAILCGRAAWPGADVVRSTPMIFGFDPPREPKDYAQHRQNLRNLAGRYHLALAEADADALPDIFSALVAELRGFGRCDTAKARRLAEVWLNEHDL